MKTVLAVMILAASALAQGPSGRAASACGTKDVNFQVKLDKTKHAPRQPEPGKALVYFIQDDGVAGDHQHYVLKVALDGAWVGAYKNNSYFTVPVEPGEHHVCAEVQSNYFEEPVLALMHFTAEPGKAYYFHTRFIAGITTFYASAPFVNLDSLDSDEAKYLIASYPLSVSSAKK